MELFIVGFGPVAGYKYSRCIHNAISQGHLSRYHVIDRESQQQVVQARLAKLPIQPATCTYIPERVLQNGPDAGVEWLIQQGVFTKSEVKKKLVITTEPQSHGTYIKFALAQQFDVLVSKPLTLPMREGVLDYRALLPNTNAIAAASIEARVNTAVLCLGRLHEIYEQKLRQPVALMMDRLQHPITSVHVKTASGVWNLPSEFGQREDHPYKYGYGMLMHGAYHYIDVLARLLLMNRRLFPTEDFVIVLQGFTAGPLDQQLRTGGLEAMTTGYRPELSELQEDLPYGETDIVASYAMKFRSTGRVLCLGTIALEQTTPGMRSWGPFPEVPYNINGRLHCTDIDVRLGTVFSIAANVTKSPIQARLGDTDIRGMNSATVVTRANARLARTQGFIRREHFERSYGNSYSYTAEADVFERWLLDRPTQSDFSSHVPSCALLDGLLRLAADDWRGSLEIDFNYPVPDWPTLSDDPWYTHMADDIAFSSEHGPRKPVIKNGVNGTKG
ncbi:hypothetical protein C8A00DRAFT_44257 [Chaetomidium leptoderma]|uniref:Gfo/Idh/MocA-like oxidoreductase N-terminal domain-containing protein n=1 Tax=Chaetomidium leptoderma TaxID=669021 RepID=A0AAN6VJI9_9PEZI|nr:hypothetical protein C8A00DRAFT_44257 [Chaetomidium leptoderma]